VVLLAPKAGFPGPRAVPTREDVWGAWGQEGGPGGEVQGKENNLPAGVQAARGKGRRYKKLSLFISSPSCLSPVGSVNMSTCDSLVGRSGRAARRASRRPTRWLSRTL